MKLEKIILENFRSYKEKTEIPLSDLTTIVGKNDIGKSTILEALDIFFDGGTVKLDKEDINKQALDKENKTILISAIFSDLPKDISIDATNKTTLEDEYLLNKDKKLEVIKRYPNAGKVQVFIKAYHPTNEGCKDLLLKKNAELKKIENNETECSDKKVNALLRKSIWNKYKDNLLLQEIEIDANKEDAKKIWDKLKEKLPLYFLFQSDRQNSDGDNEIQNPMQIAVKKIIQDDSLKPHFEKIAVKVCDELNSTANRTLDKLKEMNTDISNTLKPVVPSVGELKWESLFKNVSIESDNGISINKRGSGVKRLILLNFFRAEAEKKVQENHVPSVIYAIEEPETSQHYGHQEKLINAFEELSQKDGVQVFLTTHSSNIVKMLKDQDYKNILLLSRDEEKKIPVVETTAQKVLPADSLNEVNYLILGVAEEEYHNELYGCLEENHNDLFKNKIKKFAKKSKNNKDKFNYDGIDYDKDYLLNIGLMEYKRSEKDTEFSSIHKYIRDQIHHPENKLNRRFTKKELRQSIEYMRNLLINSNKEE